MSLTPDSDAATATPAWRNPVPYTDEIEVHEDHESQTEDELVQTLLKISDITFKDGHGGLRSVHAKSHGLLNGELRISELPLPYAQGLFAQPATLPVKMRLSTSPGDVLDDKVSTPRGLAIKVMGVQGDRLEGALALGENATQDFLFVNGPAFMAPTAKQFLGNLKLLAATTDKAPGLKRALSAVLRGSEMVVESLGGESATLKGLGGHPLTHILGETFFSQVPFLYGMYMAKWSVVPVSPELLALKDMPVVMDGDDDGLRHAVMAFFENHTAEWDLRVQLCTDIEKMPIEDPSVPWPEDESPFVTVARLTVPPQPGWSDALSVEFDDGLSFNPWHTLAAHRPLGSVNRVRRMVYASSAQARSPRGRCPVREP